MEKEIAAFKDDFIASSNERAVEDNWNHFKNRITVIVNKHVPTKVLKEKYDLPWMNHSINKDDKKKNKTHKMAKRTNRHRDWKPYRDMQKSVKRIIEAYDRYIAGLFEEDEGGRPSKKFWKVVKANKRDKVGLISLKDKNGEVMTTSKEKATSIRRFLQMRMS